MRAVLDVPPLPLKAAAVETARAVMTAAVEALGVETVPLAHAAGRTLAEPVSALRDQPPFRASAMDGWAVRRADLGRGPLPIAGESLAGGGFAGPLPPGAAVRIFTGAPVPDGADRVVIQEEAARDGDRVILTPENPEKDNIRNAGIDLRAGAQALPAGRRLDAAALSLAASAGAATLAVRACPRVTFLSTGTELVPPGQSPAWDQIFESNSYGLIALAQAWGAHARSLSIVGDDLAGIAGAVDAARAESDLLVLVGGASVGDHDLAKPALERLGFALQVASVQVRPGKPTFFGRLGAAAVLGLPGNPASAFVCAHLFLRPVLDAMLGASITPLAPLRVRLAAPLKAEGPREAFLRARLSIGADGALSADLAADQDSSLISVLALSNGLVRRAADAPAAAAGDVVEALLFEGRSL